MNTTTDLKSGSCNHGIKYKTLGISLFTTHNIHSDHLSITLLFFNSPAMYSVEQREYSVIEPESGKTELKFNILRQGNTALPSTVGK